MPVHFDYIFTYFCAILSGGGTERGVGGWVTLVAPGTVVVRWWLLVNPSFISFFIIWCHASLLTFGPTSVTLSEKRTAESESTVFYWNSMIYWSSRSKIRPNIQ